MAWKADASHPYESHITLEAVLRQCIGFALCVAATLLFIALLGLHRGEPLIGVAGEVASGGLAFLFGRYAPFALPFLIAAAGLGMMMGRGEGLSPWRYLFKIFGALFIVTSVCGLFALKLMLELDSDEAAVFGAGGFMGCFLIDPAGLNLTSLLGSTGAMILLGGTLVFGAALYADIFQRLALWRLRRAPSLVMPTPEPRYSAPPPRPEPPPAAPPVRGSFALIVRPFSAVIRGVGSLLRIPRFPSYHVGAPGRVLAAAPVMRLRPASAGALDPPENYEEAPAAYGAWGSDEDRPIDVDLVYPGEPAAAMRKSARIMQMGGANGTTGAGEANGTQATNKASGTNGTNGSNGSNGLKRKAASVEPVPTAKKPPEFAFPTEYVLPDMNILAPPPAISVKMSEEELRGISENIVQTLARFRIDVEVIDVVQGPTVTLFALRMAPGIPVKRIFAYESDLTLALCAQQIRILVPIPGQAAIGIEVPNKVMNPIMLRELMESEAFQNHKSPLAFALGKNIYGDPVISDLAQMPHLLIAGSTGAGKSVCLNTIIASMLYRNPPEKVKFVMIDPKMVELSVYDAIPHLLAPVVCDPRKAAAALDWTVEQMQKRYDLLASLGVRNIDSYNAIVTSREPHLKAFGRELKYMPHIVVIVDELADLMVTNGKEVDTHIMRLAQKARAAGIHMILATQRPSTDVITGVIKNNFPSRIAFRVTSKFDSMTILDGKGAESLLGKGDMLYAPGGGKPSRLQGAYIGEAEIEGLANFIRKQEKARYEKEDFDTNPAAQRAKAQLLNNVRGGLGPQQVIPLPPPPMVEEEGETMDEDDIRMPIAKHLPILNLSPQQMESMTDEDLYDVALQLVLDTRKASVSNIQRWLKIGYARAGRVMDMMEQRRVVGPSKGSKPRDILVDPETYLRGDDVGDE